ncbi:unnamed protein product [Fusarium graminearum]|nr:unnamed protein product [Fusarium graminearum]
MELSSIIQSLENKLFINNKYVDGTSGQLLTVTDPATGETVSSRVANAGQTDLDKAVAAAEATMKLDSPWRTMTTMERSQLLWKAADLLEQKMHMHYISLLEARSFGGPYSLHRTIDIKAAADNLRFGVIRSPETTNCVMVACLAWSGASHLALLWLSWPRMARNLYLALDTEFLCWAVMIADTSQISSAGMKLGPALAAGNCMILKPSEKTPLGTLYLGRIFAEAGFPPGVIQVLSGDGKLGSLLAHHEKIRKISFTGSVGVGKKIQEAATKTNLKRVTLELGGKSPIIVCKDAALENAAFWAAVAITSNSGQYCVAGSRVYVHRDVVDEFRALYHAKLTELASGKGSQVISQRHTGPLQTKFNMTGLYIAPTVFESPSEVVAIYRQEIFGPVLVMKTYTTEEEVIRMANATEFGLMASVFTSNVDCAARMVEALEAGTVCVNTSMAISYKAPFGGQKQSGYGSEGGLDSVLAYTQVKTVAQQLI